MRRLLLVSYEFPPKGGTQSRHAAQSAVGLAEAGWDVAVLTVADPPTAMIDLGLAAWVTGKVDIARAWSLEPTRVLQAVRRLSGLLQEMRARRRPRALSRGGRAVPSESPVGRDARPAAHTAASPTPRGYSSLSPRTIRLIQSAFFPDEKVGWVPFALRRALLLHRESPFDAVVSVGPPFSAHVVARACASRMGVPWLADLRDPMVGGYFFRPPTRLHSALWRRFERAVVSDAAHVTVATPVMRSELVERHPGTAARITTIVNGFDPAEFAATAAIAPAGSAPGDAPEASEALRGFRGSGGIEDPGGPVGRRFVLAYVGSFQGSIRPDTLLEAIAGVAAADEVFAAEVQLRLVGASDPATDAAVRASGLGGRVVQTGFLSRAGAIAEMVAADVLVLVLGPERESRLILTSKLPEYLRAGGFILALVPEDGVAAEIVRRYRRGTVAHPASRRAVETAIAEAYRAWKDEVLPPADESVVGEFDQTALVGRVDALLSRLVERHGRRVARAGDRASGAGSPVPASPASVHPYACVDEGALLGAGTRVGRLCHVMAGARVGRDVTLGENVFVAGGVTLGDRCVVGRNVSLYEGVTLEDDVTCDEGVVFTNDRTPRAFEDRRSEWRRTIVRSGARLGANCTIVCGVEIGAGAAVAPGAVVTRDVAPGSEVSGVPAQPVSTEKTTDPPA